MLAFYKIDSDVVFVPHSHQLYGRQIAYTILSQLKLALEEWNDMEGYAIPDEKWHLTADFDRVRNYVRNNATESPCRSLQLRDVVCDHAVFAASEFTPRYNPAETSIRAIIKEGVHIDNLKPNLYDPPDVRVPAFDAPDGEIDILSIVENGVDFIPNRARGKALRGEIEPLRRQLHEVKRRRILSDLEPGQGWYLDAKSAPDSCDGSYDSFCGRSADSNCLLHAHNDYRGGLRFDSLSGWMIVHLSRVKHGLIFVRLEHWTGANTNPNTATWKCENGKTDCPAAANERRPLRQYSRRRRLDNTYCDDWRFEFAIDGKISSWTYDQWNTKLYAAQRVAHFTTLLDDVNYTSGQEKDVEVAMRMTGCARDVTFTLSHIYWL